MLLKLEINSRKLISLISLNVDGGQRGEIWKKNESVSAGMSKRESGVISDEASASKSAKSWAKRNVKNQWGVTGAAMKAASYRHRKRAGIKSRQHQRKIIALFVIINNRNNIVCFCAVVLLLFCIAVTCVMKPEIISAWKCQNNHQRGENISAGEEENENNLSASAYGARSRSLARWKLGGEMATSAALEETNGSLMKAAISALTREMASGETLGVIIRNENIERKPVSAVSHEEDIENERAKWSLGHQAQRSSES